jgi:serine/threonine protein kinase
MISETVPTSIGRYQVRRLLGRGGMGEVYLCADPALGRQVAVKILPVALANDAKMRGRFMNEARAIAGLNHPNVITIHDVGVTDERDVGFAKGILYLVLEYLEGLAVDEIMEKRKLTLEECLDIGIQTLEGLKAAHQRRILHRDVTPANIMIAPDGRVKILDFGLSKLLMEGAKDSAASPRQTGEGMIVGTLDYLSPEQALGNPLDERSDLFSFGVVFYEMLVGTHPFASASVTQMVARMMTQEAHVIPDSAPIPEVLRAILAKALKKDAAERYGSAAQMLLDLMVARRELGSISRTDKLLGMARRVSAAGTRAAAAPARGAGAGTDGASPAVPLPSGPDARTPRTAPAEIYPSRRFSLAARIGVAVAALLTLGAVAFWLFS